MSMKYILGTKEEMTQIFTDDGRAVPVTVVSAGPVVVTQVKTEERDGYTAVQVGFAPQSEKRVNKAMKGHLKEKGTFRVLREFRISGDMPEEGSTIDVSVFAEGDTVSVSGVSKGKGFQGVVKRHGFHGGPRSHGQKHSEREPGSIGATGPQKVLKGTRMAGRMGGERVTVKNLKVVGVNTEKGILLIAGAVPGRRGSVLEIRG